MKVGVITIQKSPNYGACLQTYALYHFLTERGFECEVIDLLRPTHEKYIISKKYLPYRQKKLNPLEKVKQLLKRITIRNNTLSLLLKEKFEEFNNSIKYSKTYYSIDELYNNPPEYDIYISGSDQLWNPTIGFCIEPYFLTFVKNGGKKISYATSIGISELFHDERKDFSKWLDSYSAISVREQSACEILNKIVTHEVEQVCDPSFLLSRSVWEKIMIVPSHRCQYILLFTLNYNKKLLDFSLRLKKESGKELIYLCSNYPSKHNPNCIIVKDAGPKEFLGYISKADMVITNSFHGTVFSLILHAQYVYSYISRANKRGRRIIDLLSTFNIENHILENDLTISYRELFSQKLDYSSIDRILSNEVFRSQNYLTHQLK